MNNSRLEENMQSDFILLIESLIKKDNGLLLIEQQILLLFAAIQQEKLIFKCGLIYRNLDNIHSVLCRVIFHSDITPTPFIDDFIYDFDRTFDLNELKLLHEKILNEGDAINNKICSNNAKLSINSNYSIVEKLDRDFLMYIDDVFRLKNNLKSDFIQLIGASLSSNTDFVARQIQLLIDIIRCKDNIYDCELVFYNLYNVHYRLSELIYKENIESTLYISNFLCDFESLYDSEVQKHLYNTIKEMNFR